MRLEPLGRREIGFGHEFRHGAAQPADDGVLLHGDDHRARLRIRRQHRFRVQRLDGGHVQHGRLPSLCRQRAAASSASLA